MLKARRLRNFNPHKAQPFLFVEQLALKQSAFRPRAFQAKDCSMLGMVKRSFKFSPCQDVAHFQQNVTRAECRRPRRAVGRVLTAFSCKNSIRQRSRNREVSPGETHVGATSSPALTWDSLAEAMQGSGCANWRNRLIFCAPQQS